MNKLNQAVEDTATAYVSHATEVTCLIRAMRVTGAVPLLRVTTVAVPSKIGDFGEIHTGHKCRSCVMRRVTRDVGTTRVTNVTVSRGPPPPR